MFVVCLAFGITNKRVKTGIFAKQYNFKAKCFVEVPIIFCFDTIE